MEINPASLTSLLPYFESGVNRFSIGIQSFSDDNLHFLGRTHSSDEGLRFVERHLPHIENLNIDLMYGLPGQTLASWERELDTAIHLGVPHISAYQLTVEQNTLFYAQVRKGAWQPLPDDVLADFIELTREKLRSAGYENYEISNFAKPGFTCRYNTHVWHYRDYIGIGAGAHGRHTRMSTGTDTRAGMPEPTGSSSIETGVTADAQMAAGAGAHMTKNTGADIGGAACYDTDAKMNMTTYATQAYKMPAVYMQHVQDGKSGLYRLEALSDNRAAQEAFLSGLRLAEGFDVNDWPEHLQHAFEGAAFDHNALARICAAGFVVCQEKHYRLTDRGWLLLDEILRQVLTPLDDI